MKASELKTIEEELVDFTKEYVPIKVEDYIGKEVNEPYIKVDRLIELLEQVKNVEPDAYFETWFDGYDFQSLRFARKHTAKEIEVKTEELRKKKQAYVKFEIEKLENTIKKLKELDE